MTFVRFLAVSLATGVVVMALQMPAHAQMNNQPFSFENSGTGNIGMSDAARQAILNQKLFGSTPDHIIRGPGGLLLEIQEEPGSHVALATLPDGSVLQGYDGRGLDLGGFGPLFESDASGDGGLGVLGVQGSAHAVITAWTFGVLVQAYEESAMPSRVGYISSGSSSIDAWTMQVAGLPAI